jgi:pyruvate dehydrogenase (quinone)
MGSSGPGHVHLINGLYDANRSGNPVIAIASTCHTEKFGSDYFQETNPILFLMIVANIIKLQLHLSSLLP